MQNNQGQWKKAFDSVYNLPTVQTEDGISVSIPYELSKRFMFPEKKKKTRTMPN